MELQEIEQTISSVEKGIENIRGMIEDYKQCKNETSKSFLLAAISKFATPYKTATSAQR